VTQIVAKNLFSLSGQIWDLSEGGLVAIEMIK